MKTPLLDALSLNIASISIGIAATAPLAAFLLWFMRSSNEAIAAFRESQIEFFANIGFTFTWPRIFVMAIAAGVCEELFFRGVLQAALDRHAPAAVAIIATNVLFGGLHWRTALYAIIAGSVGAYLGVLFWATGGLTAPIVAHALYDLFALYLTRRSVAAYHRDKTISDAV